MFYVYLERIQIVQIKKKYYIMLIILLILMNNSMRFMINVLNQINFDKKKEKKNNLIFL